MSRSVDFYLWLLFGPMITLGRNDIYNMDKIRKYAFIDQLLNILYIIHLFILSKYGNREWFTIDVIGLKGGVFFRLILIISYLIIAYLMLLFPIRIIAYRHIKIRL